MTSPTQLRDLCSLPNALTLSRLALAAVFPWAVQVPRLALALMVLAALTDVLDGASARYFRSGTALGAILDPIADKTFALSVMASLVLFDKLPWSSALLLSVRELGELPLVVWLALDPAARHQRAKRLHSNLVGKLTTALQFAALSAILLGSPRLSWWIWATAATGLIAAGAYWQQFLARGDVQARPTVQTPRRDVR